MKNIVEIFVEITADHLDDIVTGSIYNLPYSEDPQQSIDAGKYNLINVIETKYCSEPTKFKNGTRNIPADITGWVCEVKLVNNPEKSGKGVG